MCESELPVMSDIFEVYDFENEQHWLKGRTNGIGGSDASAVVGMNPYKSNIDLFEEKIGRVRAKDISDKPCVIYGKKAEEYIRELFKLDYPEYKVEHHEFRILRSKEHPFMQASLDGELTDSEGRRGVLEIKTTNILQSMQYEKWKDRIRLVWMMFLHWPECTWLKMRIWISRTLSTRY